MKKEIILICTPLIYYSDTDEAAFYNELDKFKFIKSYKGIGRELHVYVKTTRISFNNFLRINGLFERYFFDTKQLNIFKSYKYTKQSETYDKLLAFRNELIKNRKRYKNEVEK